MSATIATQKVEQTALIFPDQLTECRSVAGDGFVNQLGVVAHSRSNYSDAVSGQEVPGPRDIAAQNPPSKNLHAVLSSRSQLRLSNRVVYVAGPSLVCGKPPF